MIRTRLKCPACQNNRGTFSYKVKSLDFFQCQNCDMVFLSQRLAEEEIRSIYDREDYQQFSCYIEGLEEKIARYRIGILKNKIELKPGMKVLDFGCGDGLFLAKLKEAFPFLELYGLDLSEVAVKKGRETYRLNLVSGELENDTFEKNYFDLVTSYHVFEHLPNPKEVIEKIFLILKPKGKLVITTPNENYLLLKILKLLYKISLGKLPTFLEKFYNREHINSFTEESLRILMESSEFKVIDFWQDERYFTKFCLECFNPYSRSALAFITLLSKITHRQAEITVVGEKL